MYHFSILDFKNYLPRYLINAYSINYADICPLTNKDIMLQNTMSIIKVAWMIAVYSI